MRRKNKTIKPDILLLYYRRRRIRLALLERWWRLEGARLELYKLVEYARIQFHHAETPEGAKIAGRHLQELEAEETRITRLQTKYDLWASRLEYWTTVMESAVYRLHPDTTGSLDPYPYCKIKK